MNKSKIVVSIVLLVYLSFVVFQFSSNDYWAQVFDSLLLPLITLAYFIGDAKKNLFFTIFLLCYSIADLMIFVTDLIPYQMYYFVGNGLYIAAYFSLLIKILKSVSFIHIIKNFKLHLLVLVALDIYIAYVLQIIVNPYLEITNEYITELVYDISMLLVLTASLLNYFYRDDKKSLFLFLGSLSIVFSEVLSVAYMYVAQQNLLSFLTTTLTLLAFYFYSKQSSLNNEEVNQYAS
tara:strand:+ start:914 stop:1618 length:705 start_codon:yes stop_codon:yes gene_type:complete